MDPELLRERELFRKRAMALPVVERRPDRPETSYSSSKDAPVKKMPRPVAPPKLDANTYKTMSGSSQYRFGVLTKIVKHMRLRHQDGDDHPLTIEEILDETNQMDVAKIVRQWLCTEALMSNPKIDVVFDKDGSGVPRFAFKPVYKIRDGKSLMRLLKQHDLKGLGGILLDDVKESLPNCEKILKNRAQEIIFVTRPVDKKKVLYYNDKSLGLEVDEDFKKLWRAATVDALDDAKIEEYLDKQGIASMTDGNAKVPLPKRRKVASRKRQFKKLRDNEHLADVLETYEDNTLTQKGPSGGQ